jgi:hypothetical protein
LWPVNSDIFTEDEFLSSYIMDRSEPADQESDHQHQLHLSHLWDPLKRFDHSPKHDQKQ